MTSRFYGILGPSIVLNKTIKGMKNIGVQLEKILSQKRRCDEFLFRLENRSDTYEVGAENCGMTLLGIFQLFFLKVVVGCCCFYAHHQHHDSKLQFSKPWFGNAF